MKKVFLFLFFFAALASVAVGQSANDWFVTRWIAPANGTINFPAIGSGYTIRYVPINHITGAPIGAMQTISPASSGQAISGLTAGWTYRIDAYGGTFNRLSFNYFFYNKRDIVCVEQWGTTQWATMNQAFSGCENMDVTATDVPDLSACQDMSYMFYYCTKLVNNNGSMSGWQTANVTNMSGMFVRATAFNQPIGNWNTQNVTDMNQMFSGAAAFNQPIGNWQTANVTNMSYMFNGAAAFNQPIGNWNTGNVTNMSGMFYGAAAFNRPIGNWQTANVTNMGQMFYGATSFNQPIGNWNTSNVTNMSYMFAKMGWGIVENMLFNQDISGWNTANVTDMSYMFSNNISFNQPIGNWNTANVTNMLEMFSGATAFNKPLNWNTGNVTNMGSMFSGATAFNKPLNFNTANVTNMSQMFSGATAFNQPIGNWNTRNVTEMSRMFSGATAFNQDLSGWDVSKVTNMSQMFSGATAFNGNVNGWGNKMKNVTDMRWMFQGARAFNQSLEGWVLNSVLSTGKILFGSGMQCQNLTATLNGWAKNSEFNPASVGKTIEIDFSGLVYSRTARDIMRYLRQNKGINIPAIGYYAQDCDGINYDQYTIKVDTRRDATGGATPTNRVINTNVVGANF